MKKYFNILIVILMMLSLFGCREKEKQVASAPEVECGDIVVSYGGNFSIYDYCLIDESTTLTSESVDTKSPGDHYIDVVASKGDAYTVFNVKVTVQDLPEPDCFDNAEYNKETRLCECKEGYVQDPEKGCVLEVKEDDKKEETPEDTKQDNNTSSEHGTKTFRASEYGSFSAAFDACVLECNSINKACECNANADYSAYILTY